MNLWAMLRDARRTGSIQCAGVCAKGLALAADDLLTALSLGVRGWCRILTRALRSNPNIHRPMMTWIKTHPAQTAVIALSISLSASTVELYREHASSRLPAPGTDVASALETKVQIDTEVDHALLSARAPQPWALD